MIKRCRLCEGTAPLLIRTGLYVIMPVILIHFTGLVRPTSVASLTFRNCCLFFVFIVPIPLFRCREHNGLTNAISRDRFLIERY